MKWYISGAMTGEPGLNFDAFHQAAKDLRDRGHEVINPAEINPDPNPDWLDCILEDLTWIETCDAMLMLKGWEDSYGAQIEWLVAKKLELHIEYEEEPSDNE